MSGNNPIIEANDLSKVVDEKGRKLVIFDSISFEVRENEIVSLLGPTGCGKTSILNMIVGLEKPTAGQLLYRGEPLNPDKHFVPLVPQQPITLPWLTVQENIEVVLEAKGVPLRQRIRIALKNIDLMGLDSFEDTYPRELTMAMRQRLSFARALSVAEELLAMDDPFTILDSLTAEDLREEFMRLWFDGKLGVKSILMTTTNVEEAVYFSDRIYVLSRRPGRLLDVVDVDLKHPRDRDSKAFTEIMDHIYSVILSL